MPAPKSVQRQTRTNTPSFANKIKVPVNGTTSIKIARWELSRLITPVIFRLSWILSGNLIGQDFCLCHYNASIILRRRLLKGHCKAWRKRVVYIAFRKFSPRCRYSLQDTDGATREPLVLAVYHYLMSTSNCLCMPSARLKLRMAYF